MTTYLEDNYEHAIISIFRDKLGYNYIYGFDIERDFRQPCMTENLRASLTRVNTGVPKPAIEEAYKRLTHLREATLNQTNETFMGWLQNGMEVAIAEGTGERTYIVNLIDYVSPLNNDFTIANQWRVEEQGNIRCDLVVFVNGLPLVVIELKTPSDENISEEDAYLQIRNYIKKAPVLFGYNAFCITSNLHTNHVGTITSKWERFMEWKTKDGNYENTDQVQFDTLYEGIFPKERFIDILHNFICFDHNEGALNKIFAGYHQYFAVNRALERTYEAINGNGKIGVFWHTQGSGKSLSMVFFAHLLIRHFKESTIVVVTDRNDLDNQLFGQFSRCAEFLRQVPVQAGSRDDLEQLLRDRKAGGIIFTTIQKFDDYTEGLKNAVLSDRHNIIVMTDEAHRSQYGDFTVKHSKDGELAHVVKGYAKLMREALPNASFIGFTGTPISNRDKDTQEVFGNYIDIYDMTQSVKDHATLPVYYESRAIKLNLQQEVLKQLDEEFEVLSNEGATMEQLEKSKHDLSHVESVLGAPETINALVSDIMYHYIGCRCEEGKPNKAMIVALNRRIAMKIYNRLLELRPDWTEKVKVVMTGGNQDPEEWHDIIGNDTYKQDLARKFKDNEDPFKIAIVVDMWLTGFDVPSLSTMYMYKPMSGHNLMQAIARVNRVFPEKEGGLIVDYVGIAQALKAAMKEYTARDQQHYGDTDISKTALLTFREKQEICRDLFHGFDYKLFYAKDDLGKALAIQGGVNFMLDKDRTEICQHFIKESTLLHNAKTLCASLLSDEERLEVAFFDAVRAGALALLYTGPRVTKAEINKRISELIKQSVVADGVVEIFSDKDKEINLCSDVFLNEVRKMKQKNIAIKMLEDILKGIIHSYKKSNLVQSQRFSDMLSNALSQYVKGLLTNEEVIEELIKLAQQIKLSEDEGNELGLSKEEKAFYDALTEPEMVKAAYTNEQFIELTKELTETLRKNRTIDWNQKESSRAQMRRMVKHLLKKYNYPPEGQEAALQTVMAQCNQWAENEYED